MPKTSAQLAVLLKSTNVSAVQLDVLQVMRAKDGRNSEEELRRIVDTAAREVSVLLLCGVGSGSRKFKNNMVLFSLFFLRLLDSL